MTEMEAGDCNVCIGGGYDDNGPEWHQQTIRTARREHKCCECRTVIPVGARYEHVAGKWDGEFLVFKTCLACVDVRDSLCSDGFSFQCLWEDAAESIFDGLTIGCLAKLATAAGKEKLVAQWRKWKKLG